MTDLARSGLTKSVTVERKDKTVVDPCVVGRGKSGKKPACCDAPEEERVRIDVWRVEADVRMRISGL